MSVSLGELVIDLVLNSEGIEDQFDQIYDRGLVGAERMEGLFGGVKAPPPKDLHLKPTVDLSGLHELNAVFESKRVHKNTIQAEWDRNPLCPKVDLSELENASQRFKDLESDFNSAKMKIEANPITPNVSTASQARTVTTPSEKRMRSVEQAVFRTKGDRLSVGERLSGVEVGVQKVEVVNNKDSLTEKVYDKVLDRGADLIVEEGGKQLAKASQKVLVRGVDMLSSAYPGLKLLGVDKDLKKGIRQTLAPAKQSSTYANLEINAINRSMHQLTDAYKEGILSQEAYTEAILKSQKQIESLSKRRGEAGLSGALSEGVVGIGRKIAGVITAPAKSAIGGFYEGIGNAYGETFAAGSMDALKKEGISVEDLGRNGSGGLTGIMTGTAAVNGFTKRLDRVSKLQDAAKPIFSKYGIDNGPTTEEKVFDELTKKVQRLSNIAINVLDDEKISTDIDAFKVNTTEAISGINDLGSAFAAMSVMAENAQEILSYPISAASDYYKNTVNSISPESASEMVTQPINEAKPLDPNIRRIVFASGGFVGKQGRGSDAFAEKLSGLSGDNTKVIPFRNAGFDTSADAEIDPAGWASSVLDNITEIVEKGFNPEAVRMAIEAKEYSIQNPDIQIDLVGHSAGGLIAKEAQAILKQWGIQTRVLTMGTPNLGVFNGTSPDTISIAGDKDPLTSQALNKGSIVFDGGIGHESGSYLSNEGVESVVKEFLMDDSDRDVIALAKTLGVQMNDEASLVAKMTNAQQHESVRAQIPIQATRIKGMVDEGKSAFTVSDANAGFRAGEPMKGSANARVPSSIGNNPAEQITFVVGGFGGVDGLEGEYMGKELSQALDDHLVVAIESPEFDVTPEPGQTATDPKFIKKALTLMSGGEDGRNVVAERLAERAYTYHKQNPDKPINLVGQSGGGMVTSLAAEMLKQMGVEDVRTINAASPHMGGAPAPGITLLSNQDHLSPVSGLLMSNVVRVDEPGGHNQYFDLENKVQTGEANYLEKKEKGTQSRMSGQVKEIIDVYFDRSIPKDKAKDIVSEMSRGYQQGEEPGQRMVEHVASQAQETSKAVETACDNLAYSIESATEVVAKAIADSMTASDLTSSAMRAGLPDFGRMTDQEIAESLAKGSSAEAVQVTKAAGYSSLSSAEDALNSLVSRTQSLRSALGGAESTAMPRPEQSKYLVSKLDEILPELLIDIDSAIAASNEGNTGISSESAKLANLKKQILDLQKRSQKTSQIIKSNESSDDAAVDLKDYGKAVDTASKNFHKQLKNAQNLLAQGGDLNVRQAREIALELVEAEAAFKEEMNAISKSVTATGDAKIAKKIGTAKGRITRSVKTAQKLIADTEGVGKDVSAGYNKGLSSDLKTLQNIAQEMGSLTIEALRKELQTRSPSKKSMAVGEDVGEGYWIGLKNSIASSAQDYIAGEAVEPLNKIKEKYQDLLQKGPLLKIGSQFSKSFISGTKSIVPAITSTAEEISSSFSKAFSLKIDTADLSRFSQSLTNKVMAIGGSIDSAKTKIKGLSEIGQAAYVPALSSGRRFIDKFNRRTGRSGPSAFAEEHLDSMKSFGEVTLEQLAGTGIDKLASPSVDVSKVSEEMSSLKVVGLDAFASIADSARNHLPGISGRIDDVISLFRHFGSSANVLIQAFASFHLLKNVGKAFRSLARQGLEAANSMEDLELSISFASGGAIAGMQSLEMVRQTVKSLRGDLMTAATGFTGLAAASKDTFLEGKATNDIFEGVQKASIAYQLDPQKQERVFLAVQQMISKNTVSAEELRQQLGEALPGAFQIAARSMGMTTQELSKMLETGQLTADEFLPRFAQQLSAETSGSLGTAAKSTQAGINNLNTSLLEFRATLGEPLQPVQKLGLNAFAGVLDMIAENAGKFMKAFTALTIVISGVFIKATVASVQAVVVLLTKMGVFPVVAKAVSVGLKAIGSAAKQAIVATAALYAIFEVGQVIKNAFSDGGEEIQGFVDSAKSSLQEYKQALLEAKGANLDFADSLPKTNAEVGGSSVFQGTIIESVGGKGLGRGVEESVIGALNAGVKGAMKIGEIPVIGEHLIKDGDYEELKFKTKAERDAYSRSDKRNQLLSAIDQTDSEVFSLMGTGMEGSVEVKRVREIDSLLSELQMQRRSLLLGDKEKRETLDSEIDDLLSEREEKSAPVSKLQQAKQAQIQAIELNIKMLKDEALSGDINAEEYKKQMKGFQQRLSNSKEMLDVLSSTISLAVDELILFAQESQSIASTLARNNHEIAKVEAQSNVDIAGMRVAGMSSGAIESAQKDARIDTSQNRLAVTSEAIRSLRAKLSGGVFQEVLQNTGTASSYEEVFSQDIRDKAERLSEGSKEQKIFRQGAEDLAQLEQLEIEAIQISGEIMATKADAAESIKAASRGVRDFFEGIQRDADSIALDVESASSQMDVTSQQNKLKSALIDFQGSFIDDTVDSLIGLLDTLNKPLQDSIESQKEILSLSNKFSDQQRQAQELERTLPTEMLNGSVKADESMSEYMPSSMGMDGYVKNEQEGLDQSQSFVQSYGRTDPFEGFSAFELVLSKELVNSEPMQIDLQNDDVARGLVIANESYQSQVDLSERRLELSKETAQIEASMQTNGLVKQFEESRESIMDVGDSIKDQFSSIRRGLGDQKPTSELEHGLLDIQDQFTETNERILDFEDQLRSTIHVASQEIEWINGLVASGQMAQSFADTLIPEIEETIATAQYQLSGSSDLIRENKTLMEEQRGQIIKEFDDAEKERRIIARRRIDEGRLAIGDVFSQIQSNPFMEMQREAARIGMELEDGGKELDNLLKAGEITNAEYESMRKNMDGLNQVKLTALTSEFERVEKARRKAAQRRIVEGRGALETARIENFRPSPFRIDRQRLQEQMQLLNGAEQESVSIALEFDAGVTELDDLLKAGELTKLEYGELKENLIGLNEIKLDGLRNQFESLLPTVDSIVSALNSARGEFDEDSYKQIEDNLRLASASGALTEEQASEARSGLRRARDIAQTKGDNLAVQSLMGEDNAFTGQFLSQLGRGDLVDIANLGIQNQQAESARRGLRSIGTDPEALANELTRPELAQPNMDASRAFMEGSDRMVAAMEKLTMAIAGSGDDKGSGGVNIGQQVIQVTRSEEEMERAVAKKFNKLMDQNI